MCGSLPEPRFDAAACMMDSTIYVTGKWVNVGLTLQWSNGDLTLLLTGGCNPLQPGGLAEASAWRLCPLTNVWKQLADMKQPRRLHALVHLDNKLYAVGGQNEDRYDNLGGGDQGAGSRDFSNHFVISYKFKSLVVRDIILKCAILSV